MTTVSLDKPHKGRAVLRRKAAAEYQQVIRALSEQVKEWAESSPGWTVTQEETIQEDAQLGSGLHVTTTAIDTPQGHLVLEPLGFSFGGRAVVEFWAYPKSYNVRLLHEMGNTSTSNWRVLTNSGIYLHDEWNRDNFLRLAHDLLNADWQ